MTSVLVDTGKEAISEVVITDLYEIAVGTGTTSPSNSDTSLENEVYRSSVDNSNVTISDSSNNGEIDCSITISGGTEVSAGTTVTEFGVFTTDGRLVVREVRSGVTLESGDRKTFEMTLTVTEN